MAIMDLAEKPSASFNALDVGRGVAILAVMYGHALAPWFMSASDHFSQAAFIQWKLGAAFMMPFFFFLSGVSWRSNRSLAAACQQGLSLLVLAWLANVSFELLHLALSLTGVAQVIGIPNLSVIGFVRSGVRLALLADQYSLGAMWFLAVLGIVRIIAAFAVRGGKIALIGAAVALVALTVAAKEYPWRNIFQIELLGAAFAFFIAGNLLRDVWERVQRMPWTCAGAAVVAGALTLATFSLNLGCHWNPAVDCGADWLNGQFGVQMVNGEYGNWLLFTFTAVVGTVFASCCVLLLARFGAMLATLLARLGKISMDLLIVNAFFVVLVAPPVAHWLAPRLPAQGVPFFLVLLATTLLANIGVRALLARQLKQLRGFARRLAAILVATVSALLEYATDMQRFYRVSRGHE